jgi:predicted lipid carrier protein YhbT
MWGSVLTSKEGVIKGLERVKGKFHEVEVKNSFKDFNKSVQFVCLDIDLSWAIRVTGGEVKVFEEGTVMKPDISIVMDSDTFLAFQNREITVYDALAQDKLKITGIVADLTLIEKHLI